MTVTVTDEDIAEVAKRHHDALDQLAEAFDANRRAARNLLDRFNTTETDDDRP